jgi:spore coat polysaccharide biosynthesis protein SpsF
MKIVAIVQARMSSARFQGKVMVDLCGRPVLAQQLRRLRLCSSINEIVVATTTDAKDDPIADLCRLQDVRCVRGCELDVLSRYWLAAKESGADLIARVEGNCPLIDPGIVDKVVDELLEQPTWYDYASNVIRRTYPYGLDVEVFWRDTLERLDRMATSRDSRESVTHYLLRENPALFAPLSVTDTRDYSHLRWKIDSQDDLVMIKGIYRELELTKKYVSYEDTLKFVKARPWLSAPSYAIKRSA